MGLVNQLIIGLSSGMVLVLIAIGLSLIFGLGGTINFAHGAFFMLGAYAGLGVLNYTGNFFLTLLIAPLVVGIIAMPLERIALKPIYDLEPEYQLLTTWGLALIITEGIRIYWGLGSVQFPTPATLAVTVQVLGIEFPLYRIFLSLVTVVLIAVLFLIINNTDYGIIIRGSTYKDEVMELMGINIYLLYTVVFGVGSALAAFAGVMAAPVISTNPEMGNAWIVQAFIVVVVGGLGSLKGAVVAGLLIGVLTGVMTTYIPALSNVMIFLTMIAVLVIRPAGLFGSVQRT